MGRPLTNLEVHFLKPIYKNTLRYGSIRCEINKQNVGGVENSITPAGVPYFSTTIFCADFSKAGWNAQWTFVHEMMHVWQWGHHVYPVLAAIGAWAEGYGNYTKAYAYDIAPSKKLAEYNLEQQASIVADYWSLSNGGVASDNNAKTPNISDYVPLIDELQKSGPSLSKSDQTPIW